MFLVHSHLPPDLFQTASMTDCENAIQSLLKVMWLLPHGHDYTTGDMQCQLKTQGKYACRLITFDVVVDIMERTCEMTRTLKRQVMGQKTSMPQKMVIEVQGKEGGVPLSDFLSMIGETLSALKDVEQSLRGEPESKVEWKIEKVRMRSPLRMTISPECKPDTQQVSAIGPFIRGLRMLEKGKKRPPHFGDSALEHVKKILSLANNGLTKVVFSAPGVRRVTPGKSAVAHTEVLIPTRKPYWTYTQLEGRLENIITHGKPEFHIFDPVTDNKIRCMFSKEKAQEIMNLGLKRVRVTGETKFDENHVPVEVKVDSYQVLREQSELPQLGDLHKAKIDITGGEDSIDYVRRLRDGRQL